MPTSHIDQWLQTLVLLIPILVLLQALLLWPGQAAPSDYAQLPAGFQISSMSDIAELGPCNASNGTYTPPGQVLNLCAAGDYSRECISTNYIPSQPGKPAGTKCAWVKSARSNDRVVSFIHRVRCTTLLNGSTITSADGTLFKFCPKVGDAFFDVVNTVSANLTSWSQCTSLCDAEPSCAAVQTDGQACTLLATHAKGGYDSWFRLSFHGR